MNDQKRMFWQAHDKLAKDNLIKNLELARKKRFEAVEKWRKETGADDSRFDEYVAEADRLVDVAEQSILER
jgi:ribosomal protein L32E